MRLVTLAAAFTCSSPRRRTCRSAAGLRPRLTARNMRDVAWRRASERHPLAGVVLKGDQPIPIEPDRCARSPLQQLIVEIWSTIRGGGIVLLGEVHDNPEHHAVRGDILRPRLDADAALGDLFPAAAFEHIRTNQQPQLDAFYGKRAQRARADGFRPAGRTALESQRLACCRDLPSAFRCSPQSQDDGRAGFAGQGAHAHASCAAIAPGRARTSWPCLRGCRGDAGSATRGACRGAGRFALRCHSAFGVRCHEPGPALHRRPHGSPHLGGCGCAWRRISAGG